MSINETLGTTVDCILEVKLVLFVFNSKLTLIQHNINLFKDNGNELCVFVADVTKI